jgi:aldehyde dehydrogenase (NAD+)
VHEDIASKFITGLKINYERASQDLGGSPLDARTTLGPVADEAQLKRVLAYIEEGKQAAQLVTGGKQKGTIGFFIEPTIFLNPAPNSKIYRQEIFGPVIVVKTFKTEDEVIELANDTEYGLSGMLRRRQCLRGGN